MISHWQWVLLQISRKLWFRATLFAIAAVVTALVSILFKSFIPSSFSIKVGAEAVDNILNILASSMLTVTTFYLCTRPGSFAYPALPLMYVTPGLGATQYEQLKQVISLSDVRAFTQAPRRSTTPAPPLM